MIPSQAAQNRRLLLLTTTTGYQTRAFAEAAAKLDLSLQFGTDRCHVLDDPWQDGALPIHFEKPDESAQQIIEAARNQPIHGIVALGDCSPPAAARAARALGLPYHPPEAADICRDKYRSRRRLSSRGIKVPQFIRFPLEFNPREIVNLLPFSFPCVLKPLALSASRGVIRAGNADEFVHAFERIRKMLHTPAVRVMRQETSDFLQVEEYIEGTEVAMEALLSRGELKILAIFDKPDPLVGPYFGETIYVTPSRLSAKVQSRISAALERAVRALGLYHGPLHAELRLNEDGVSILEIASRPIGGLCSRALRFVRSNSDERISLEELLIRLALGERIDQIHREPEAAGVMMIPVEEEGIFEGVEGLEEARAVPGIEEIIITARPAQKLAPLPEGSSYPGFIFARGPSPAFVEQAIRRAHQHLRFILNLALPVV